MNAFSYFRATGLSVLLAASPLAAVHAQPSEPADCQMSASSLRTGRATSSDVLTLGHCSRTGPAALADAWERRLLTNQTQLDALVEASGTLRDARIYRATAAVAAAPNQPIADRLGALQVLVRYFDPRATPSMDFLVNESRGSPMPRRTHALAVDGETSLPAAVRPEIARLVARLASTDPDPTVHAAALRVRQALAFSDPAFTPLEPSAIALVAGCGLRVTLRSTADVDLIVQLRVMDARFDRPYGIVAGSAKKPTDLLLSLPAGTVVAFFGGREVARLNERAAPCRPDQTRP